MTNLTETGKLARNFIKYGSVAFFIFILAFVGFKVYQARPKPAAPIVPKVEFGKLPKIKLPQEEKRPNSLILQTIHGDPPIATAVAYVYKTEEKIPNLIAGKQAQKFAESLNFFSEPTNNNNNIYVFSDIDYPARSLTYNVINGIFKLEYNLSQDSLPLTGNFLPTDPRRAANEAVSLLSFLGKLNQQLSAENTKIVYLDFINNEYVETLNTFSAKLVRIDFFRTPINEYEIKTPQKNKSSVYVILSGNRVEQERIIAINYDFYPIQKNILSTYPLKTSQAAWDELLAGGGFVANLGEGNDIQVYVRDGYIAYYDSGEYQKYLQPIFVFTGDREFEAYVPAIDPVWVE